MGWNTEGLHRRKLLLGGSIVSASLLMAGLASAGTAATPSSAVTRAQAGDVVVKGVEFKKNDGITLAGNIYYPKGFNEGQKYPTIVVVHPGGASKSRRPASMRRSSPRKASSPWHSTRPIRAPAAACPASLTIP
jgi:predicted acyl esterase